MKKILLTLALLMTSNVVFAEEIYDFDDNKVYEPLQGLGPLMGSGPLQGTGPLMGAGPLQGVGPLMGNDPNIVTLPIMPVGLISYVPSMPTITIVSFDDITGVPQLVLPIIENLIPTPNDPNPPEKPKRPIIIITYDPPYSPPIPPYFPPIIYYCAHCNLSPS